jgi:hypothetical protein
MSTTKKTIAVYVCTDPDCPSYYGANDTPDLSREFTGPKVEDKAALKATTGSPYRKTRATCPVSIAHGERQLVVTTVSVSTQRVPMPALPAH